MSKSFAVVLSSYPRVQCLVWISIYESHCPSKPNKSSTQHKKNKIENTLSPISVQPIQLWTSKLVSYLETTVPQCSAVLNFQQSPHRRCFLPLPTVWSLPWNGLPHRLAGLLNSLPKGPSISDFSMPTPCSFKEAPKLLWKDYRNHITLFFTSAWWLLCFQNRASRIAQLVKNTPAILETPV